jgi:hypothetical protein
MTQYMLTIYQPDGPAPPAEFLESVGRELHALNQDLKAAGAWVFSRGLHPSSTATVVRVRDRDLMITDGPYVEGKEHIGGFWVIEVPDLDRAIAWAAKATVACGAPVEVRPFQEVV